jgi:hypothetical protein
LVCDASFVAAANYRHPGYAGVVILGIILGTVPIGYDGWPNIVGILLGCLVIGALFSVGFVFRHQPDW